MGRKKQPWWWMVKDGLGCQFLGFKTPFGIMLGHRGGNKEASTSFKRVVRFSPKELKDTREERKLALIGKTLGKRVGLDFPVISLKEQ